MDKRYEAYALADRHFCETPDRVSAGDRDGTAAPGHETAGRAVPEGRRAARIGDWLTLTPVDDGELPRPGPTQGWKVHASATRANADRIAAIVWDCRMPRNIRSSSCRARTSCVCATPSTRPAFPRQSRGTPRTQWGSADDGPAGRSGRRDRPVRAHRQVGAGLLVRPGRYSLPLTRTLLNALQRQQLQPRSRSPSACRPPMSSASARARCWRPRPRPGAKNQPSGCVGAHSRRPCASARLRRGGMGRARGGGAVRPARGARRARAAPKEEP